MLAQNALADFAQEIALLNDLPLERARELAALIGDTPEIDDQGRAVVIDEAGVESAIILPTEDED